MGARNDKYEWDWVTIVIVAALLIIGIINLYSAAYNPNHTFLFDFHTLYGKQIIWIGCGIFIGIVISLIDADYIRKLSPIAYLFILFLLIAVLFTPPVNGARSWLGVGSFGIQPSEFAKLGMALILAYIIGQHRGNTVSKFSLFLSLFTLLLTMVLILMENDTGTFLVFTAFFFVMYREGITFDPIILFILNSIFGFRVKKTWVGTHFIPVLFVILFFSIITLFFTDSVHTFSFLPGYDVPGWLMLFALITMISLALFFIIHYFVQPRNRKKARSLLILTYVMTIVLTSGVSYTYLNVLQPHQKVRIDLWLGKIQDPNGKDYNRNRALAAVGSGGFTGVGYQDAILASPQTNHVPESQTDFIFAVLSEEWGFLGDVVLVVLFTLLLIRIIMIAERQKSRFARIFANSVAMILFYHFAINVGMNIGVMPVIGIPLPFFSYGGSSMMSFLIMICILLKLDSQRKEVLA